MISQRDINVNVNIRQIRRRSLLSILKLVFNPAMDVLFSMSLQKIPNFIAFVFFVYFMGVILLL